MKYVKRLYDAQLQERLKSAGAVLIRGVRACGKTETARQVARSSINLLLETDARIAALLQKPVRRFIRRRCCCSAATLMEPPLMIAIVTG
jgi:hypothetical protein